MSCEATEQLTELVCKKTIKAIAISGRSGCGNTTVNHLVAQRLGFQGINYTMRNYAERHGISLEEVARQARETPKIDQEIDRHQVEMCLRAASQGVVLSSRLAIWLLPKASLKVYLYADNEVRGRRILQREGGNLQEQLRQTEARDARDAQRYRKLYGIDSQDIFFADLIINIESFDQYQVANIIVETFRLRQSRQGN